MLKSLSLLTISNIFGNVGSNGKHPKRQKTYNTTSNQKFETLDSL